MFMEKAMSVEEKIRRAEEIYNRRNGNYNVNYSKNKEKKGKSFTYRMVKQIIVCFIIYGIFYVVTNREYFLSEEFKGKVESIVSQNETLNNTYHYIMGYIEKYFKNSEESGNEQEKDENAPNTETEQNLENNDENIGGANEESNNFEEEKSQEEIDVADIKNTTSFIIPVEGTISSTFGWRTPTTSTVPKYHTGIDIAADTGTVIVAATEGTVSVVSSEGDYGNHLKIENGEIATLYAHCNKLYVEEGATVKQGDKIAEVGETGRATGPHLHFEIRRQDRFVNPEEILS